MGNKILVVEDDLTTLKLIQSRLEANGYQVVIAMNGVEGLQKIKEGVPDLIITDILMPNMDGYVFYKELKKEPTTQKIPVLILTARGKMEDSFRALAVDGFLVKPFETEQLLSEVGRFVQPVKTTTEETKPRV